MIHFIAKIKLLMSIAPQISDIFTNLDNSRDRLIEFEEFKVSRECTRSSFILWYESVMESMRDRGWSKDTKEAEEINEEDIRWVEFEWDDITSYTRKWHEGKLRARKWISAGKCFLLLIKTGAGICPGERPRELVNWSARSLESWR